MKIAVHLPQYGRVAGADAITRAARHAEELGFAGVWVSDHIVQPAAQDYPSPYLFDPMVTLTWAAAVTEHVDLGTSVLVVPQHNPLELANMLASLDALSGGRVSLAWASGGRRGSTRRSATGSPIEAPGWTRSCGRGGRSGRTTPRPSPASTWRSPTCGCCPSRRTASLCGWVARARVRVGGPSSSVTGTTSSASPPRKRSGRSPRCAPNGPSPSSWCRCAPVGIPRAWRTIASGPSTRATPTPASATSCARAWRTDLDDWLRSMDQLAALTGTTPL